MKGCLDMGRPKIIDPGASERVGSDPVTAKITSHRINPEE
jgi:hypothetical protein